MLPVIIVIGETLDPYAGIRRVEKATTTPPISVPYINPTANCTVSNVNMLVDYMVPFRHDFEWIAFKSWSRSGVRKDLTYDCGGTCTPLNCTQKDLLEVVTGGFNCGLNLSDGCGGYLQCKDNCAANEVCSVGIAGSSCELGKLDQCLMGESMGHCRVDNGCVPVIEAEEVSSAYGRMGCIGTTYYESSTQACGSPQVMLGPNPIFPVIFYRLGECLAGESNGVVVQPCYVQFSAHPIPSYYPITDNQHFPYEAYFLANPASIYSCSGPPGDPGGGGGTLCDFQCIEDCMIIWNDEIYCNSYCNCV